MRYDPGRGDRSGKQWRVIFFDEYVVSATFDWLVWGGKLKIHIIYMYRQRQLLLVLQDKKQPSTMAYVFPSQFVWFFISLRGSSLAALRSHMEDLRGRSLFVGNNSSPGWCEQCAGVGAVPGASTGSVHALRPTVLPRLSMWRQLLVLRRWQPDEHKRREKLNGRMRI